MPPRPATPDFAWTDVAIAGAMALLLVLAVIETPPGDDSPALFALAVALALVQGAALVVRRRRPEAVAAVTLAGGAALQLLCPGVVIPFAALVAVFGLTARRPPRVSIWALAALLGVSALDFLTASVVDSLFVMTLGVVAWALGEIARDRAAKAERDARLVVERERARIARELHDVIAHNLSVIVVQAGAAGHLFAADPEHEQAQSVLGSIESSGREALAELRLLLGAMDTDAGPVGGAPQPGLARLEELVGPLRAAGLSVDVRREGQPTAVPQGVDLSAFRIVQEALTNTLRHADATRAEVAVRYRPDALEIAVCDDGRGRAGPSSGGEGHGLVGMRERVAIIGGTIDFGRSPDGGFRVHARLPLGASR